MKGKATGEYEGMDGASIFAHRKSGGERKRCGGVGLGNV